MNIFGTKIFTQFLLKMDFIFKNFESYVNQCSNILTEALKTNLNGDCIARIAEKQNQAFTSKDLLKVYPLIKSCVNASSIKVESCFNNFEYIFIDSIKTEEDPLYGFKGILVYILLLMATFFILNLLAKRITSIRRFWWLSCKNIYLWQRFKLRTIFTITIPIFLTSFLSLVCVLVGGPSVRPNNELMSIMSNNISMENADFISLAFDDVDAKIAPPKRIDLYKNMLPVIGLFFLISLIYPFSIAISELVTEKATKMKDMLLITGTSRVSIVIADIWARNILFSLTALGLALLSKYGLIFEAHTLDSLFFFFLSLQLALYGMALVVIVFFQKPRQAILFGILLVIITHLPVYGLQHAPIGIKMAASWLPPVAAGLNLMTMITEAAAASEIVLKMIQISKTGTDSHFMYSVMLVVDFVLFLLVSIFLDYYLSMGFNKSEEIKTNSSQALVEEETVLQEKLIAEKKFVNVKNLIKRFGSEIAINNLSTKFFQGHITAILGPNGAGKSTFFGILTGLINPTGGKITVYGDETRKERIGYCPQTDSFYADLTVKQNLLLFYCLKCESLIDAMNNIMQLCKDFNIHDKIDNTAGSLSGGQKRKLAIIIALLGDSRLIVLDEPTAGM